MTLDEAIKHCEEVAEEQDKLCKRYDDASGYSRSHNESIRVADAKWCERCAKEHRQLAEWLKELKQLREPLVSAIPIPEGATNGDMIKAMFPNARIWKVTRDNIRCACVEFNDICEIKTFPLSWWNAPYKAESEVQREM